MRTKIFVTSMGLAASVWLTGCQNTSSSKNAACGSNNGAAVCKAGTKDDTRVASEKTEKTARLARRAKTPTSSVPPAPCTACAKCGGACGTPEATSKTSDVATASCSCPAKTGSGVVPATIPSQTIATLPAAAQTQNPSQAIAPPPVMPNQTALPAMPPGQEIINLGSGPGIVQNAPPIAPSVSNYGPGVEVVSNPGSVQPTEIPAVMPGQQTVANNVMTVRFGQANNYQTVVGQVYQFRRAWKLRYTAVESDDKYGGSLTLVGDNLDHLKDGQMVEVQGAVLPSDDRASGARYHVNSVRVLEPDVK